MAQAERYTGGDVGRSMARQARLYDQSREFFERFDYFVLPATQVLPFDVNTHYPTTVAGVAMSDYVDWMRACWYISLMGNPPPQFLAVFLTADCRSDCKSSVVTAMSGASCSWRMRSSKPRTTPVVVRP